MKKIAGVYSIILGISIISLWFMLLLTSNVPELNTEPIEVGFHLFSEGLMGVLLILSGILIIKNTNYATTLFLITSGLVIYSVINAAGYYGNNGEWVMVVFFLIILIATVTFDFLMIRNKKQRG